MPPQTPLSPAGPAGRLLGTSPAFPRAPKPVFQASGACRSDVLTAQVAKATNTRHMSFWLKVNEVRAPWGSPRREKPIFSSSCSPQTHLCGDMSALDTSGTVSVRSPVSSGTHFLSRTFPVVPLSQDTRPCVARSSQADGQVASRTPIPGFSNIFQEACETESTGCPQPRCLPCQRPGARLWCHLGLSSGWQSVHSQTLV